MSTKNKVMEKFITHSFHINSLEETEDKTQIKIKALIHTFDKSHNGWAISEDTANKYKHTLVNKHIVTRYYTPGENGGVDCLGDHEPSVSKFRDTDITIPTANTRSIGTITNAYIDYIDSENPSLGKALWIDGVLLVYENMNECSLLCEWAENGIKIITSVEWFYTTDMVDNDGTQWIVDPTYSHLCILNSEHRGNMPIIYGNYDASHIEIMMNKMNDAIKLDMENDKSSLDIKNKKDGKEGEEMKIENIFMKSLNDISFGEVREKIYAALSKVMTGEEYTSMYISMYGIYDTYIIYETYLDGEWATYRINYTKDENDEITVDYESKQKVERKEIYVEVSEVESMKNSFEDQIKTLKNEKQELETQLSEKDAELVKGKEDMVSLNETIQSLNQVVEELKPYKAKVEQDEYERQLNEKIEFYKGKFEALNAKERFETDEIQGLIKETLDIEKATNAKSKLADILLDCVKVDNQVIQNDKKDIKEVGDKKLNGLIKTNSYENEYGFSPNY